MRAVVLRAQVVECTTDAHGGPRPHGAGALATTSDAVIATLRHAFADRGRVWREWRAALAPLARPDAAMDIARHVLAVNETRPAFPLA